MKHLAEPISNSQESTLELAELILRGNPDASIETLTDVISEWGGLYEEHRSVERETNEKQTTRRVNATKPPR
jgi:hypothetical protein